MTNSERFDEAKALADYAKVVRGEAVIPEREQAKQIASKVLDRVNGDPDDDLAVLSRQFNRSEERLQRAIIYLQNADAMRRVGSFRKKLIAILTGEAA
jgi:hypothetical protein